MRISDAKYGFFLTLPGLLFLTILIIFPLATLIGLSFCRYDFINPVEFVGLENFKWVIEDRVFWIALVNTVIYSTGVTIFTFLIGLLLALTTARISKLSTLFRTLIILPWAVPSVVSGLVWRWMLDPGGGIYNYIIFRLGLIKEPLNIFADPNLAMIGVILADTWSRVPFMFITILAAIKSIQQELYEAARIDGASMIKSFRHITLPLAKRGILVGILITSMFSFRTIDVIWSMTRGGPAKATYVLGLELYDYIVRSLNLGYAAALGLIMLFLISTFSSILVYYILKR
ncbi:MAG: sugar ABC transporter permease [Candidatus Methanomethylicaceae archaeon]